MLNAAKEVALEAFIARRIGLLDIARIVEAVMTAMAGAAGSDFDAVYDADAEARRRAAEMAA